MYVKIKAELYINIFEYASIKNSAPVTQHVYSLHPHLPLTRYNRCPRFTIPDRIRIRRQYMIRRTRPSAQQRRTMSHRTVSIDRTTGSRIARRRRIIITGTCRRAIRQLVTASVTVMS